MNMKVLIASLAAAALTISGAASADYQGKSGKGRSHGQSHKSEGKGHGKSHGNSKSAAAHARKAERSNTHAAVTTAASQARNCPRGLAKKNNGCVAPGLAKKKFAQGDKLPAAFGTNNVPAAYASQYRDTATSLYRYAAGNVYKIDATSRRVAEVIKVPTL